MYTLRGSLQVHEKLGNTADEKPQENQEIIGRTKLRPKRKFKPKMNVGIMYSAQTDENGRFVFDRVAPGILRIIQPTTAGGRNEVDVEIKAGRTTYVQLDGTGRPVIAHSAPQPETTEGTGRFP